MKKNMFFAGRAAIAFVCITTLTLVGCEYEQPDATLSIYGTAKVGNTITVRGRNLGGNFVLDSCRDMWFKYNKISILAFDQGANTAKNVYEFSYVIQAADKYKYIRARSRIFSNLIGPVTD